MAVKQYLYNIPGDYTFDSAKIDISGGIVSLKENLTNVYARYHLNSIDTGNSVEDTSGNSRDGVAINSPSVVAGKLNNCFQFNGSNYVNCGDIANFERTDSFSFEFWMKAPLASGVVQMLLAKNIVTNNRGWLIYKASNNHFYFDLRNIYPSNNLSVACNPSIWNNSYHHIVVTYNGSSSVSGVNIYVNNVSQILTTAYNTLSGTILNAGNMNIASRRSGANNFTGILDEVIIYDKELTVEEVVYR